MLTKTDLEQIGLLIDKRVEPLNKEVSSMRKEMRQGFKRVDRKINIVISGFDSEILDLRSRTSRIENH
ncbi:MAG TPA: hypothetical protein VJA18_04050, partial [Candidatus Nanoarchaeia archaeon]|nr:hypothetical protein [Candidatus Nanoarchaeia archaeon]